MESIDWESIKPIISQRYGRWELDWTDAFTMVKGLPDYFSKEETDYIAMRYQGYSHTEAYHLLNISKHTAWNYQRHIFWKFHYVRWVNEQLKKTQAFIIPSTTTNPQ